MPTSERENSGVEKKHEIEHSHGGSVYRLMRRVHSLEDLLKKLRWERNVVKEQQQQSSLNEDMGVHVHVENSPSYRGGSRVFEMPLHYPHYSKEDYDSMAEWRLDILFQEYGLAVTGDVEYKRHYAKGAFLWPDQY